MRTRDITLALAVLVTSAAVLQHKWRGGQVVPDAGSEAGSAAQSAARPRVAQVPAARPNDVIEAAATRPSVPPPDRSDTDTRPTSTPQDMGPPVIVQPAPRPQLNDPSGTPESPGDPLAQPENPSEQFMHSRRGDGQHDE